MLEVLDFLISHQCIWPLTQILAILMCVKWYFIVVSFFIFVMTNYIFSHDFLYCFSIPHFIDFHSNLSYLLPSVHFRFSLILFF